MINKKEKDMEVRSLTMYAPKSNLNTASKKMFHLGMIAATHRTGTNQPMQ